MWGFRTACLSAATDFQHFSFLRVFHDLCICFCRFLDLCWSAGLLCDWSLHLIPRSGWPSLWIGDLLVCWRLSYFIVWVYFLMGTTRGVPARYSRIIFYNQLWLINIEEKNLMNKDSVLFWTHMQFVIQTRLQVFIVVLSGEKKMLSDGCPTVCANTFFLWK